MPRAKQPNPANNRTDLQTPQGPTHAVEAPDQAYGNVTAQAQSQKLLPIGTPTQPAPAAGPAAAGAAPAPVAPPTSTAAPASLRLEPGDAMGATLPTPAHEFAAQQMAQQMQAVHATSEQGTLQSVMAHLAAQPQASSIIRSLASAAGQ